MFRLVSYSSAGFKIVFVWKNCCLNNNVHLICYMKIRYRIITYLGKILGLYVAVHCISLLLLNKQELGFKII